MAEETPSFGVKVLTMPMKAECDEGALVCDCDGNVEYKYNKAIEMDDKSLHSCIAAASSDGDSNSETEIVGRAAFMELL
jgi:hypothetical protein